jgi:tetraacyldisaccharide 4'-kinase
LFPLAILYGLVTEIRNVFFRLGVLKKTAFPLPIISVGNLSTGGTGKTPHLLYIAKLLEKEGLNTAVVSRGYGRKSKGFFEVISTSTAREVGDESLVLKQNLPNTTIAVCESRVLGVNILLEKYALNTVLLDDAYQHQHINRSLNLLITDFEHPFYNDFLLPCGNLRELRHNKNRADIIVISKCPENLSDEEQKIIEKQINPLAHQKVFFTRVFYKELTHVFNDDKMPIDLLEEKSVMLLTSIAKPKYLNDFISTKTTVVEALSFPDHHCYTAQDAEKISALFSKLKTEQTIIITTQKDAVKLRAFSQLKALPLYAISMDVALLNKQEEFNRLIVQHVRTH